MPLPTDPRAPWPPADAAPVLASVREHGVWYSADPVRLREYYDQYADTGGMLTRRPRFWGRGRGSVGLDTADRRHVPVASDIARMSADLLFSEAPVITSDVPAAQDRIGALVDAAGLHPLLLAAAETTAALGGQYWRIAWDLEVAPDRPLVSFSDPDCAVGEWAWGELVAVTFWRRLTPSETGPGRTVWRHLERHTRGRVEHALYAGDDGKIGARRALEDHPATAGLASVLTDQDYLAVPADVMTAGYIPNMLPNRRHRGAAAGRSDLDGLPDLLDMIDETWTSLSREFRVGKARIMVPSEYLRTGGPGRGASFDFDREIYQPLSIPPTSGTTIEVSQPAIRVAEHDQALRLLVAQAVTSAGYSVGSFGLTQDGAAVTATEIKARERLSMLTATKKARYWARGLRDLVTALLRVDAFVGFPGAVVDPGRVTVEFADSVADDPRATAETVEILNRAGAMSTEMKVRTVHPDWPDGQVMAEVATILGETGMVVADPTRVDGEDETDPGTMFTAGG